MEEEMNETKTPILADKLGIKYREVDGIYYPIWWNSDVDKFASVGKYGYLWMTLLMEHDRYLYNKYFLDGNLIDEAKIMEDYCWELHDLMFKRIKKKREKQTCISGSIEWFRMLEEISMTVEEVINSDICENIDYKKRMRLANKLGDPAIKKTEDN